LAAYQGRDRLRPAQRRTLLKNQGAEFRELNLIDFSHRWGIFRSRWVR
jgi:hypothetical protein